MQQFKNLYKKLSILIHDKTKNFPLTIDKLQVLKS
jgi:hypothetical protein